MICKRSIHTSRQHQRLHLYLRQTLIFFSLVVLAFMHRMGIGGIEPLNLCYVTIASIISENTNDAKSE